jgi:hypothetical protein
LITAERAGGMILAGAAQEAVADACSAGALPYVSDIGLRRVPGEALACP